MSIQGSDLPSWQAYARPHRVEQQCPHCGHVQTIDPRPRGQFFTYSCANCRRRVERQEASNEQ